MDRKLSHKVLDRPRPFPAYWSHGYHTCIVKELEFLRLLHTFQLSKFSNGCAKNYVLSFQPLRQPHSNLSSIISIHLPSRLHHKHIMLNSIISEIHKQDGRYNGAKSWEKQSLVIRRFHSTYWLGGDNKSFFKVYNPVSGPTILKSTHAPPVMNTEAQAALFAQKRAPRLPDHSSPAFCTCSSSSKTLIFCLTRFTGRMCLAVLFCKRELYAFFYRPAYRSSTV
jgi:hypothetical protein